MKQFYPEMSVDIRSAGYIKQIFKEFEVSIKNLDDFCQLKKVNYVKGSTPDYNSKCEQQYYLLRYSFAYMFEYSQIFSKIKKLYGFPYIKALSIGCGAGLDYWGIDYTVMLEEDRKKSLYHGVDLADWGDYSFAKTFSDDDVKYFQTDIVEYLSGLDRFPYNYIIFPKSISDLSDNTIDLIVSHFKRMKMLEDEIWIIFSYRKNDNVKNLDIYSSDKNKSKTICDGLAESGYKFEDIEIMSDSIIIGDKEEKNWKGRYERIVDIYNKNIFSYPSEVSNYLPSLYGKCKKNNINCKCELNKLPMTRIHNINYFCVRYRRV